MSLLEKDFIVYHIIIGFTFIKTQISEFIEKLKNHDPDVFLEQIDLLDPLKIPKYHSARFYNIAIVSSYNKLFLLNQKIEELNYNLKSGNYYTDLFNLTKGEYPLKEFFSDEDSLNWVDTQKQITIFIQLYKQFNSIIKDIDKTKVNIAVLNTIKTNLDLTLDSLLSYQEELT